MFVSDDLVYLQMWKTGSTHIAKILAEHCGGHNVHKHSALKDYERHKTKLIASSIRNPWDWYVSLWAFGCSGQGGLRQYLDQLPLSEWRIARKQRDLGSIMRFPFWAAGQLFNKPDWAALYEDPTNTANFRQWLKLVIGADGQHIGLMGYASSPVSNVVGFMTYRYLTLSTEYRQWTAFGRKCVTYPDLTAFADKHTIVAHVLRMESLNDDLLVLLNRLGVAVSARQAANWGKSNSSSHRRYSDYYDEETRQLVAVRDRFIVERFGYAME